MFAATKSAGTKPLPEFVSASTPVQTTNASITLNAPSGISAGDLLVMLLFTNASGTITTSPTGWSPSINNAGTNSSISIYIKIATSSEPSTYSFTSSASAAKTGSVLAYRKANAVNVAGTPQYTSSSTTQTAASISPTKIGALVAFFGYQTGRTVATPPSGMTNRVAHSSSNPSIAGYDLIPSLAGATGSKTIVFSGPGTSNGGGVLIQIVNQ